MLSGLDGLQRTDPVLHLFPVLGTEDEPTERSDHLKEEGGVRSWVSEGYRQREEGRERERIRYGEKEIFQHSPSQPAKPLRMESLPCRL